MTSRPYPKNSLAIFYLNFLDTIDLHQGDLTRHLRGGGLFPTFIKNHENQTPFLSPHFP